MAPSKATASKPPPAKLLNPRLRYRIYVVWGFPVDKEAVLARKTKLSPENEKASNGEFAVYVARLHSEFESACCEIMGGGPVYLSQVATRVVYDKKGQMGTVIPIVQCTRRDDTFLPSAAKVQEMKEYFAGRGHFGEPGWFIVRENAY
ncbi:hypothetical protein BYT27DRAFT_7243772 [Phlegmacium glaucopus]|nr:hypothetical protein BYT27DRAFT_7243772 [Phlegmacium glaucopus]